MSFSRFGNERPSHHVISGWPQVPQELEIRQEGQQEDVIPTTRASHLHSQIYSFHASPIQSLDQDHPRDFFWNPNSAHPPFFSQHQEISTHASVFMENLMVLAWEISSNTSSSKIKLPPLFLPQPSLTSHNGIIILIWTDQKLNTFIDNPILPAWITAGISTCPSLCQRLITKLLLLWLLSFKTQKTLGFRTPANPD